MVEGQTPIAEYETGNTHHTWDLRKLKKSHKILAEYSYKKGEIQKGFANRTLYINLSTLDIKEKPVTEDMKKKFTGGRGFGLKLMWDAIKPTTRWNSEENDLIVTTGPLCGNTQYPGSGKSICFLNSVQRLYINSVPGVIFVLSQLEFSLRTSFNCF